MVVAAAVPLAAGCMANEAPPAEAGPPPAEQARAVLTVDGSTPVGEATFTQLDNGVRVMLRVDGLPPGVHAAHIHTTGTCTPPNYTSAGGHWNPEGHQHGRDNPEGQHMGDMPNIIVGESGAGTLEVTISYARIEGGPMAMLDEDGAAVMIHAGPDDYHSNPAGNAGPRIACGVIEPVG
jgi:Cu-Zn family superoxide dismutase